MLSFSQPINRNACMNMFDQCKIYEPEAIYSHSPHKLLMDNKLSLQLNKVLNCDKLVSKILRLHN